MTDSEYLADWCRRLAESFDKGDKVARWKLIQEARARPHMQEFLNGIEFVLPRLDNADGALKAAMEIALKSKLVVNVNAEEISAGTGATIGVDLSTGKKA